MGCNSDPQAIKLYAEKVHSTEALIKKSITEFQPKETMQSDRVADVDGIVRDAVKPEVPRSAAEQGTARGILPGAA